MRNVVARSIRAIAHDKAGDTGKARRLYQLLKKEYKRKRFDV